MFSVSSLATDQFYQLRFEHHRVKMLIAAHDFPDDERRRYTAEVREVSRGQRDDGYLTFRALLTSDRFASCPVRLQARSVSGEYLDRLTMPYFLNFEKTFLYRMYLEGWSFREDGDTRPFGLVVGLPHVRGGAVLHDADLPGVTGRTTLVHKSFATGEPPSLTLEPYKVFLKRLVRHWRAGTPVPTVGPREEVRPRLERWMVERLGSGPALVVFAWLHGFWHDPHKRYVTMRRGVPCLCVTQPLIAHHSGLGADSVKQGLARLKDEGLICTRRGDRRTYVTVAEGDGP
jgi:hypothetical protein